MRPRHGTSVSVRNAPCLPLCASCLCLWCTYLAHPCPGCTDTTMCCSANDSGPLTYNFFCILGEESVIFLEKKKLLFSVPSPVTSLGTRNQQQQPSPCPASWSLSLVSLYGHELLFRAGRSEPARADQPAHCAPHRRTIPHGRLSAPPRPTPTDQPSRCCRPFRRVPPVVGTWSRLCSHGALNRLAWARHVDLCLPGLLYSSSSEHFGTPVKQVQKSRQITISQRLLCKQWFVSE